MSSTAAPDEELMDRIGHGDADAVRLLYARYGRLVFGIAMQVLGDASTAEEVCQDVFMRAWEKSASYRADRGKVVTWLARIARNRAIDVLRSLRSRPAGWTVDDEPSDADEQAEDPGDRLQQSFREEEVRAAVASLPAGPESRPVAGILQGNDAPRDRAGPRRAPGDGEDPDPGRHDEAEVEARKEGRRMTIRGAAASVYQGKGKQAMNDEHAVRDLLPGYALGILEDGEKNEVREHLARCASCRAELAVVPGCHRPDGGGGSPGRCPTRGPGRPHHAEDRGRAARRAGCPAGCAPPAAVPAAVRGRFSRRSLPCA